MTQVVRDKKCIISGFVAIFGILGYTLRQLLHEWARCRDTNAATYGPSRIGTLGRGAGTLGRCTYSCFCLEQLMVVWGE